MSNIISWKRSELARMRTRMEDLFDEFFGELSSRCFFSAASALSEWQIFEDETEYIIKIDLPGLTPKDIEIDVRGEVLTVQMKKEDVLPPHKMTDTTRKKVEFSSAQSMQLPKRIRTDDITASYKDDVLTIVVPKGDKPSFRIEIRE